MKNIFLILICGVSLTISSSAQTRAIKKTVFSSVYTDLNKECKPASTVKEQKEAEARGQDTPLKCKGYGGYQIYFSYSAEAAFIYASDNLRDSDATINLAPQNYNYDQEKNRKIEWRLADGVPFAVILRISNYNAPADLPIGETHLMDKYKTGESLIVKGLRKFSQIDFNFNAKTPSVNAKARQTADDYYLKNQRLNND